MGCSCCQPGPDRADLPSVNCNPCLVRAHAKRGPRAPPPRVRQQITRRAGPLPGHALNKFVAPQHRAKRRASCILEKLRPEGQLESSRDGWRRRVKGVAGCWWPRIQLNQGAVLRQDSIYARSRRSRRSCESTHNPGQLPHIAIHSHKQDGQRSAGT